jgi:hypothetical protein
MQQFYLRNNWWSVDYTMAQRSRIKVLLNMRELPLLLNLVSS